jgi:hypothetical protein
MATATGNTCRFLALPAELRLRVYDHFFLTAFETGRYEDKGRDIVTLPCTCRQIFNETIPHYTAILTGKLALVRIKIAILQSLLDKTFLQIGIPLLTSLVDLELENFCQQNIQALGRSWSRLLCSFRISEGQGQLRREEGTLEGLLSLMCQDEAMMLEWYEKF